MNGPARYILPTAWNGWPPGPAATLVVPIWLEAGQLGEACSVRPGLLRRRRDRGLRAVGDPAQGAGQARRHREVEVAEELVAVVAIELEAKSVKRPATEFEVPAARRGRKGRIWPGHWLPFGPESMLKI